MRKTMLMLCAFLCTTPLVANNDVNLIERYCIERWGEFDDLHFESKNNTFKLYYQGRIDAYHDIINYIDVLRDENEESAF